MAHIKHSEDIRVQYMDDVLEVEASIEFVTSSDILSYKEISKSSYFGWGGEVKPGHIITELYFNVDSANQLKKFLEYLSTYRAEIR